MIAASADGLSIHETPKRFGHVKNSHPRDQFNCSNLFITNSLDFSFGASSFGEALSTADRGEAGQYLSESINGVEWGLRKGVVALSNTTFQNLDFLGGSLQKYASAVSDELDVAHGLRPIVMEGLIAPLLIDVNLSCVPNKCVAGWTVWFIAGKRSCVVDKIGDFSIASSNGIDSYSFCFSHNKQDYEIESNSVKEISIPLGNDLEPEPKSILNTKTPKHFYFNSSVPHRVGNCSWGEDSARFKNWQSETNGLRNRMCNISDDITRGRGSEHFSGSNPSIYRGGSIDYSSLWFPINPMDLCPVMEGNLIKINWRVVPRFNQGRNANPEGIRGENSRASTGTERGEQRACEIGNGNNCFGSEGDRCFGEATCKVQADSW